MDLGPATSIGHSSHGLFIGNGTLTALSFLSHSARSSPAHQRETRDDRIGVFIPPRSVPLSGVGFSGRLPALSHTRSGDKGKHIFPVYAD